MGKQRGMRVLGGVLRRSQVVLLGLVLGCGGGAGEGHADKQAPAVGRPADAKGGPRVGVVVIASKDVRVQPSQGAAFPAEQGVMLVRDDRLVTTADAGSFVVVELYNGHLVRFNQGTEIAVEKIAVFDAPRASDDLAQRFEKVLRPEELGDEKMRGAISRVAGWNSRMTASETIAVLPAQAPQPPPPPPVTEAKKEMSRRDDGAPSMGGVDDPQADTKLPMDPILNGMGGAEAPEEDNDSPGKSQPRAPDSNQRAGDDAKKADKKSSKEPSSPDPEEESSSARDLPDKVTFEPDSGAASLIKLPLALALERARLAGCAGQGALLRAHVVKGLIKEIVIDNGKKCSLETSRALSLADGWLEMRVK